MNNEQRKMGIPTTFFSGGAGTKRPLCKYFSASLSCSPRKSENRRETVISGFLNKPTLVRVTTVYVRNDDIPSPTFCGSFTLIVMNLSSIYEKNSLKHFLTETGQSILPVQGFQL